MPHTLSRVPDAAGFDGRSMIVLTSAERGCRMVVQTLGGAGPRPQIIRDGAPEQSCTPRLAVSPTGAALAFWEQRSGPRSIYQYTVWGAYRPSRGAPFGAVTQLSRPLVLARTPVAVVDRGGRATVAWWGLGGIETAGYIPGGGWRSHGTPSLGVLDISGLPVQMAVNARGDVALRWSERIGGLRVATRTAEGVWTPAQRVGPPVSVGIAPEVAVAPDGTVSLLWSIRDPDFGPSTLFVESQPLDGPPTEAQRIGLLGYYFPTIAVDGRGDLAVAWLAHSPESPARPPLMAAVRPAGATAFTTPAMVAPGRAGPSLGSLVSIGSGGFAVVWSRRIRRKEIGIATVLGPDGALQRGVPGPLPAGAATSFVHLLRPITVRNGAAFVVSRDGSATFALLR
jgi:hypothetical protein